MKNYSVHVDMDEILSWIGVKKEKIDNSDEEAAYEAASLEYAQHSSVQGENDSPALKQGSERLDPSLMEQIRRASSRIESDSAARYTYAIFDIEKQKTDNGGCENRAIAESRKNRAVFSEPTDGDAASPDGDDFSDPSNGDAARERASQRESQEVRLKGCSLILTGDDISDLLKECDRCILLAVTVGGAVDRTLRKAQISDMANAVILDFCASSAVEDLCNQINDDLEKAFDSKGFFLTDRFSPGYGDLPIELQREICRVLQTDKRLGLSANASNMLIPSKSITAVIGIAKKPQPKKISGCANCKMKDTCMLRKAGRTCE